MVNTAQLPLLANNADTLSTNPDLNRFYAGELYHYEPFKNALALGYGFHTGQEVVGQTTQQIINNIFANLQTFEKVDKRFYVGTSSLGKINFILGYTVNQASEVSDLFHMQDGTTINESIAEQFGTTVDEMKLLTLGPLVALSDTGAQVSFEGESIVNAFKCFNDLGERIETLGFTHVIFIARPGLINLLGNFGLQFYHLAGSVLTEGLLHTQLLQKVFPRYWVKDGGPRVYFADAKEVIQKLKDVTL